MPEPLILAVLPPEPAGRGVRLAFAAAWSFGETRAFRISVGEEGTEPPTNGLLIIRYLFGLHGPQLIQGAVDAEPMHKACAKT